MTHAIRAAWNANRHWVAAGFLVSTSLFLLVMFVNLRNDQRENALQKETGLGAVAWEPSLFWRQRGLLPARLSKTPLPLASPVGTVGGVPGGVPSAAHLMRTEAPAPSPDRQVIRTGLLQIITANPAKSAQEMSDLATHLSGFVVSSKVSGSDERTRSAEVVLRIPAADFDDARAQVRRIATSVAEDNVEARDVTREYVDEEAKLNNYRAEEAQYRAILKRATAVKDIVEVSSKLAEVRGEIEELEAEMRLLRHQVEMSQLTIGIAAIPEASAFWTHWRPLYQAKLSLRDAVGSLEEYADSVLALILYIPVIVVWAITILALVRVGWMALRRFFLLFFPRGIRWFQAPPQAPAQ